MVVDCFAAMLAAAIDPFGLVPIWLGEVSAILRPFHVADSHREIRCERWRRVQVLFDDDMPVIHFHAVVVEIRVARINPCFSMNSFMVMVCSLWLIFLCEFGLDHAPVIVSPWVGIRTEINAS